MKAAGSVRGILVGGIQGNLAVPFVDEPMAKTTPLTQNRQTMTSTTKNPERTIWAHQSGHKNGEMVMSVVCETYSHRLIKKIPTKLNRL